MDPRRRRRTEAGAASSDETEKTILDATRTAGPGTGARPALPSGAFGRYADAQEIARGGMGAIYRAVDPEIGREVAIKVAFAQDGPTIDRFLREARVAGQLEHPNVSPVYEKGRTPDGRHYFVMKLIRGRSMDEILADPAPDRRRLLSAFVKVCEAVRYAHSRGVVHRDLKPANLMIGEFGEVLVMDWGIARVRGEADVAAGGGSIEGGSNLTQQGSLLGTPGYMAPEQAEGDVDAIDARTDVYALGAVLYEILTGSAPYRGRDSKEILNRIRSGRLQLPSQRAPRANVPRELEAVVLKAMAREPVRRYAGVTELQADVEAYLDGRTLAAAAYSPWQVLAKWAGRNKARVAGAAATSLAIAAGLIGMAVVTVRADREKFEAQETARLEEERRLTAARIEEAERHHGAGKAAWAEASESARWNPADPAAYFQPHLTALLHLARSLQAHPEPPAGWRERVLAAADELQQKAQEARNWSLARMLAESVALWGAAGDEESASRVRRVADEEERVAARDLERLEQVLETIRNVESSERKRRHGRREPGELRERARRLARATGPAVTREILRRFLEEPELDEIAAGFLIETLTWKKDLRTRQAGVDSVSLVERIFEETAAGTRRPSPDQMISWVLAVARLDTFEGGVFERLRGALTRAAAGFHPSSPIGVGAMLAQDYNDFFTGRRPLRSPTKDPAGFVQDLEDLGSWLAAMASSGRIYTGHLLDRLEAGELSPWQTVFVLDQLGLVGDDVPPDPDRPERRASAALWRAYSALPDEWLDDRPPEGTDEAAWRRSRTEAIAAARNLARLEDPALATALAARRRRCAGVSAFRDATRAALVRATLDAWPEPGTAAEHFDRGLVRVARGDWEGGLADLDRALALEPGSREIGVERALVLRNMGRVDEAMAQVESILARDPEDGRARWVRGLVLEERGDHEAAEREYSVLLERDPSDLLVRVSRARLRLERGQGGPALADYDLAVEADPECATLWANRGVAHLVVGRPEAAIADLERALSIDPHSAQALVYLGQAHWQARDAAAAMRDVTRAIRFDPWHAPAYTNRAVYRSAMGDVEGAIDDYGRALEIDPETTEAVVNRGAARMKLGRYEAAVEDFDRALERSPDLWRVWGARGQALARLGRREQAARSFERGLEVCPAGSRTALEAARRAALGD